MREIYACQLDFDPTTGTSPVTVERVELLVREWVSRPVGCDPERLRESGVVTSGAHRIEIQEIDSEPEHGWICTWVSPNDADDRVTWKRKIALGATSDGVVRITLRIGLEQAGDTFDLTPPHYIFAAPAIVRTLLKEFRVIDGGADLKPQEKVVLSAEVDDLIQLLTSDERRLPVVVVTTAPSDWQDHCQRQGAGTTTCRPSTCCSGHRTFSCPATDRGGRTRPKRMARSGSNLLARFQGGRYWWP